MSEYNDVAAELVDFFGEGDNLPTAEQWHSLVTSEHAGPVVMVNLLKFVETAEDPYEPGSIRSGFELITLYNEVSSAVVARVGGTHVYSGGVMQVVIGNADWDGVGLIEYPNIAAFLTIFQSPDYRAGQKYREAACEKHHLIMTL